jgi:regulatory protein
MKITALKVSPRNKTRVRVYLDGQYAFSLVKIEAIRLKVGQELDPAGVARLRQSDADEQAYERALKFLSVRPRSEAEVRRRLHEHEIEDARIETVLARLRRAGLVNDKAFADYWVENRGTFRPKSKRALRAELKRKGVSEEALGEALEAANDAEAAYQVAARRAPRLASLPYVEFRRKLGEFLARRGFSYDTVEAVVGRVWKETRAA